MRIAELVWSWWAWAFGLILTLEVFIRLRVLTAFASLATAARRAGKMLLRRASDRWKEQASGLHARKIFYLSLKALLLLFICILPLLVNAIVQLFLTGDIHSAFARIASFWTAAPLALTYGLARRMWTRLEF